MATYSNWVEYFDRQERYGELRDVLAVLRYDSIQDMCRLKHVDRPGILTDGEHAGKTINMRRWLSPDTVHSALQNNRLHL